MRRPVTLITLFVGLLYGALWYLSQNSGLGDFLEEFSPILILLAIVALVIGRLPPMKGLAHLTPDFRKRRVMNWLPLGLTYAFLYMGRYNLKVSKFAFEEMEGVDGTALMANADFGVIFMWGTIVYGCSFLINGPLTDRLGGRFSILMGAGGALVANLFMGLATLSLLHQGPLSELLTKHFVLVFSVLYGVNMYFQSFGAVAIVKVNSAWFHVNERGVFGAIFGVLISLGIYFAFDLGFKILGAWGLEWVFFVPVIMLAIFWILDVFLVRNTPSEAGQQDFDTADASSGDDGPQLGAIAVFKMMMKNPIILTIAGIEFCSGFLRQAIMQWYRTFAKQTDVVLHLKGDFVYENWGLMLCCAGITSGVIAGVLSDRLFQSRRGPVAGLLYAGMLLGGILMVALPARLQYSGLFFDIDIALIGWLVVLMSACIIGVHGMLAGTASMDFGGKKNVGVAVGIIDGFVYLGTAVMSGTYAVLLPQEQFDADGAFTGPVTDPHNWLAWPVTMIIMSAIGLALAWRIRNAKPKGKAAAH